MITVGFPALPSIHAHSILADAVTRFQQHTNASLGEADHYLTLASGDLLSAVSKYYQDKLLPPFSPKSQAMPTLLEHALEACRSKRIKVRQSDDVVVVLDATDLSRTCLISREDAAEVSLELGELVEAGGDAHIQGAKCLLVLSQSSRSNVLPLLMRKDPHSALQACRDYCYVQPVEAGIDGPNPGSCFRPLMRRPHDTPMDWVSAYETFLRIIARSRPANLGLPLDDVEAALPKIEAVARITAHYEANEPDSAVKQELENLYLRDQQLWRAIAKDAARWLMIGCLFKSTLIFEESYKHVAGAYPDWPWETSSVKLQEVVPLTVVASIRSNAKDLLLRTLLVDQELLCLTLTTTVRKKGAASYGSLVNQHTDPIAYDVLNVFRDWISSHLSHVRRNTPADHDRSEYTLCDHAHGECLIISGLYRITKRGGDAYLQAEDVITHLGHSQSRPDDNAKIRTTLKKLKAKAAEIVAPLMKRNLQYPSEDRLPYLTCININDADVPWAREVKVEGDSDDEV